MKQKNKKKRLELRIKAFDDQKNKDGCHRPGSLKR